MKSHEIRKRFIDYFKKNAHMPVDSSSLIPESDPTLLFANAGMNQFKNVFLGLEQRDYQRAVSSQKCVRAGGKHNDLENVGFTARHHTFFEMLGNFSFGDYFKKDAIHFAWDLLVNDLKIPKEKLYVTVFQNDEEAADIWHKQEGLPKDRIFRLGEKDNFWRMGDTGPCGPSTEIFYDHGPKAARENDPFKGISAGEDRFVEIWNLVFMQFFEKSPGNLEPLPKPSVDTGAGLERVTAALQGKLNNYDTDLFWPMIQGAAEISRQTRLLALINKIDQEGYKASVSVEEQKLIAALRVVADHTRSCSLLIADGALPSNEGRGYVLRRILRRAVRFSQILSGKDAFLPQISELFISEMSSVFPELKQRKSLILSTLQDEQDRFMSTLGSGTEILNEELKKIRTKGVKALSGEFLFKLYDTYGFPTDLTRLMAEEQGYTVDESGFENLMGQARQKAKASWKGKAIQSDEAHLLQISQKIKNEKGIGIFKGFDSLAVQTKILLLSDGKKICTENKPGGSGVLVTAETPFYAEGGGQVGDVGSFSTTTGARGLIHNTAKNHDIFLHFFELTSGQLEPSQNIELRVELSSRRNTASNHSATHLLHAALRKHLGHHVGQAGSLVDPQKLRFDFTHNKSLSANEIQKLEETVNAEISQAVPVVAQVMNYKEALNSGAMALFGEKYGDQVRVLKMGEFSCELCGGTHVGNTSQIRMFKIVSESGVSSGIRRIEAITGEIALNYFLKNTTENLRARSVAGLNENWSTYLESQSDLSAWIEAQKLEIKNLEKDLKKLKGSQINLEDYIAKAQVIAKAPTGKFVFADVPTDDRELLATIADQIKDKIRSGVIVAIGQGDTSHPIVIIVTKDLVNSFSAGALLKEIAGTMGGKGGGRPDFAQGSVPDRSKIGEAHSLIQKLMTAK